MLPGSISRNIFYEKLSENHSNSHKTAGAKADVFLENIKEKTQQEKAEAKGSSVSDGGSSVRAEESYERAMAELMQLVNGHVTMNAVSEVSVRRIRAEESDHIKGFAAEGYTLKAQVSIDEQRVYIEQKNEDGSYQAYEVNPLLISKDTDNPIEQMAAEAWEKATKRINAGMGSEHDAEDGGESFTFEKMLEEFQAFVEKRIKEGPPKIPTGGAEFSEEEWERMLEKIDEIIDEFKEELRQRIQKQDDKMQTEQTQDTDIAKPRGSSFLARLARTHRAPYSYLADESGQIVYNGVTFYCDDKKQQICLGDMTDTKNVLNIPLSKGGCLRVNRNNLGDLAKAIGMFSPEDVERILRAIANDNRAKQMQFEIEQEKMKL